MATETAITRMFGSVMGALVGDAAGATLEFARRLDDETVEWAMTMPGGGALGVGPGQITDDGELTLALMRGLTTPEFDVEEVARQFGDWFRSDPFDCGRTTRCAFGFAATADEMLANAAKYNMLSEANGALMRTTPVAARYHRLGDGAVAEAARRVAALSHPSPVCLDTAAAYCVAVARLIRAPDDPAAALVAAESVAREPGVRRWLTEDALNPVEAIDCSRNIGHVKHAFTLAFHYLRRRAAGEEVTFEAAIRETLRRGGDTDTNACIVGGMVGAWSPPGGGMLAAVLAFDPAAPRGPRNPIPRPAAYRAAGAATRLAAWVQMDADAALRAERGGIICTPGP